MERSTLLPAILPGTLSKTPMTKIAYDTYAALLRLFIHYMSRVRHRVDQPPMNHMIDNEGTELSNQFYGFFFIPTKYTMQSNSVCGGSGDGSKVAFPLVLVVAGSQAC